jgi:hypothetical protein
MESRKEPDCQRLELLLIRRHIEQCETCRVELTNLLKSDLQGPSRRRESDKNMSEDEWRQVEALRSESVRRHSEYQKILLGPQKVVESDAEDTEVLPVDVTNIDETRPQ